MKRRFLTTTLAFVVAGLASPAFSYDEDENKDVPNLLIVKVKASETEEQEQEQKQDENQEVYLTPLTVDQIPYNDQNQIDFEALAKIVSEMEANAEVITINSNTFDKQKVPAEVMEIYGQDSPEKFNEQEQEPGQQSRRKANAALRWQVWSPWGSIGNAGYYGYGYRPYHYGYHNRYRGYHGRWGYYNRGRHYHYKPSWYNRRHGGYNYYYYYR